MTIVPLKQVLTDVSIILKENKQPFYKQNIFNISYNLVVCNNILLVIMREMNFILFENFELYFSFELCVFLLLKGIIL